MGIKYFFKWFKTNYNGCITYINHYDRNPKNVDMDVLLIDMNGIIHNAAQKIYGYGSFNAPMDPNNLNDKAVFKEVCVQVNNLVFQFKPKELILCIDGVAPISKQIQQRQRRFRSAYEREENKNGSPMDQMNYCPFDSNCISPGTEFMDGLSHYLNNFIKYKQTKNVVDWKDLIVVFANDKVPGEGEHKLMDYVRRHGNPNYNYCIYGSDADLIMLAMAVYATTTIKGIHVLRDAYRQPSFIYINVVQFIHKLKQFLRSGQWINFDDKLMVFDFVFLCFMVGNDFLPHIPSIEIAENGIELLLNHYMDQKQHITFMDGIMVKFHKDRLAIILNNLVVLEKDLCEKKLNSPEYQHRENIFKDNLMEKCCDIKEISDTDLKHYTLNIEAYRKAYAKAHFKDVVDASITYLEGMQWVLTYYTLKVPNWKWCYEYDYAPNLQSITSSINMEVKKIKIKCGSKQPKYSNSTPVRYTYGSPSTYSTTTSILNQCVELPLPPFHQLLCILPPQSSNLLPEPLCMVLHKDLKVYAPKELTIDYAGKQQEWEGIVLLPKLNQDHVKECYLKNQPYIDRKVAQKRNIRGRTFRYVNGQHSFLE